MELNLYVVVGGAVACFVVGVVLTLICVLVWRMIMGSKADKAEQAKQQIMDGLDRSCEAIDDIISGADLTKLNLPHFKRDLARRVATLAKRLEEFHEQVDVYYARYLELRIGNFEGILTKIDDFAASLAGYGSDQSGVEEAAEPQEAAADAPPQAAAATAPAAPAPAPPAPLPPVAPAPTAAPDIDVGATMLFEMPQDATPPAMEPPPAPAFAPAPPQPAIQWPLPEAPQPQMAEAGMGQGVQDSDIMFGQTIQFSRLDVEAARRGQEVEPMRASQPAAFAPPVLPQGRPPQSSAMPPMVADSGEDETLMFAPSEVGGSAPPQQPVYQPPRAPAPPPVPVAPPQPAPALRSSQPQDGQQRAEDGSLISGDDLMEQMDAFFKFKE